ncbi:N-acetylglucosamine-6-phosphate deacetylase [Larkinella soli]|uniref:N-acetylglucosamine-6-phosphate deacetylase n=1 Tax=Larkinella soli TaxID=1770527 RepID=UPI000FFC11DE|nr:N-acetylglucosamine-6-phosphate deacetylase [Larkinella soli]
MQEILLNNATVFTGEEVLTGVSVRVSGGFVQEVTEKPASGPETIDLEGNWLVPGFVDLQLYGGSDLFLNELPTAETVDHIYRTHLKNGTTSVLPTLYSTSHAVNLAAVEAVRQVQQTNPNGVLGLHVEGPYINMVKRGAHSANYVRKPEESELTELFEKGRDVIRILTIAPEIFTPAQLRHLLTLINPPSASQRPNPQTPQPLNAPTLLSLGHSNATYREATDAFDGGIALATHLYNAMRPFESREPGVVGAVFDHPGVRASIIADGFHCDWATIRIARRLLGDRLFLISDATLANPPRPEFAYEDFIIRYEEGRYLNQEGKLAGSSITLLEAVRNCIRHVGIEPFDALRMASTIPAEIIGRGDTLGRIKSGYVANLTVLNPALEVTHVLADGILQTPLPA